MTRIHPNDKYKPQVFPLLTSKLPEFILLGYNDVTEEMLWTYLIEKKWRKVKTEMRIHQIIDDIYSIRVGDYMNYATVEAFKIPDFGTPDEIDIKEFKDLF